MHLKDSYRLRNLRKEDWFAKDNGTDFEDLLLKYESFKKLTSETNEMICLQKSLDPEKAKIIKQQIKTNTNLLEQLKNEIDNITDQLPNAPHISVPIGVNSDDNIVLRTCGDIVHKIDHYNLTDVFSMPDICGSRFIGLSGQIAKIERALYNFMLDKLSEHGFQEYSLPVIVNNKSLLKSRHLPKDEGNMFKIDENLYLIPTTEVTLMNILQNITIDKTVKICGLSECFRRESGAAGKDTKGLIRLHEFKKCEMVVACAPDKSYEILEEMVSISCDILKMLHIPYRVLILCTGDMPFSSAKTYDIEIPIGGKWREVASISNTTDFQSATLNIKYLKGYAHCLNGSALAVGRTLASLIEVHYDKTTGLINIPDILKRYINRY